MLIGTVIWGLWESGPDFWALAPRADVLVVFGLWLLLLMRWRLQPPSRFGVVSLVIALVVGGGVLVYAHFNDSQQINGTLAASRGTPAPKPDGIQPSEWPAYGHDDQGTRYSPP